ncbi:MAG: aminodeoxychorismate synthase component I [Salinibacter sp.]
MLDPHILARPGTVLLDTAAPNAAHQRSWCFASPSRILTASTPDDVPALLAEIETETEAGRYAAGYLSYEAGFPFVDLPAPEHPDPAAWFGVYDAPTPLAPVEVGHGLADLEGEASAHDVAFSVPRPDYVSAVERIRRHIEDGDVYQVNYTAPVRFRLTGDPRVLYRRLRRRQHVPYGAYLNVGPRRILSLSPELFFRRRGDRVVTRPMKGTIRRGRTLAEDRALRQQLAADPKNRAENLMIVDLLRNDLSVCCAPGSVEVPELYTTEPYDSVTQMTSTVEGRLRPDRGTADLLRALFPCGSVTGAPKRRAMRLIRTLEPEPRGVYCGAIGVFGPETADVSVAIRTLVVEEERGQMGVGSGVVWDSSPAAEYEECELKTRFLTPSASSAQIEDPDVDHRLIETMRFDGVRLPLLDRHATRLARSADYFGYPFDEGRFRDRVERAVLGTDPGTVLTVRVTLDRWGRLTVTTAPLEEQTDDPWRLTVAAERADRTDPFFFHKTTHRGVYRRARTAAQENGLDEALLLNQDDEVTEGTYSSIFARRGEALQTPPVDCGLLDGVYRDYVLEVEARAEEAVLTLDDLRSADALYCCNALRGWHRAVLDETPAGGS